MSRGSYVLAIDQGTTSTRAILFDTQGEARATAQVPLKQIYPAP
jgi:glycerol kinase